MVGYSYERELWEKGYKYVAGVDEAGRGPLAGPLVAAAVILPGELQIELLDDSKRLSSRVREEVFERIRLAALSIGIGVASVEVIDGINVSNATYFAMRAAINRLSIRPDFLLVDGFTIPGVELPQKGIVHGDALSCSIAAASVVAKVTRDRLMCLLEKVYPGYGFAKNKGYPTKFHICALQRLGPCPAHRLSFSPVSACSIKAPTSDEAAF